MCFLLLFSFPFLIIAVVFIVTFVGIDVVSCVTVMIVFSCVYVALIGVVMHFSIPPIPISQLSLAAIIVTTATSGLTTAPQKQFSIMLTFGCGSELQHSCSTRVYAGTRNQKGTHGDHPGHHWLLHHGKLLVRGAGFSRRAIRGEHSLRKLRRHVYLFASARVGSFRGPHSRHAVRAWG